MMPDHDVFGLRTFKCLRNGTKNRGRKLGKKRAKLKALNQAARIVVR